MILGIAALIWLDPVPRQGGKTIAIDNPLSGSGQPTAIAELNDSGEIVIVEAPPVVVNTPEDVTVINLDTGILPNTLDLPAPTEQLTLDADDSSLKSLVEQSTEKTPTIETIELIVEPKPVAQPQVADEQPPTEAESDSDSDSDSMPEETEIAATDETEADTDIQADASDEEPSGLDIESSNVFYDRTWVAEQPKENFTIEVVAAKSLETLAQFVAHAPSTALPKIAVTKAVKDQRVHYMLLGSFGSMTDAEQALEALVGEWTEFRPWIRPFSDYSDLIDPNQPVESTKTPTQ
ncbi:MAG: hypothetical protein HWE20_09260 [Gammaproteobacteria bacterium]|nr:hypothetical protein [Gammaproteobacteria bacterium]